MGTKKQLVQRCEELEIALQDAHDVIDTLRSTIEEQKSAIAEYRSLWAEAEKVVREWTKFANSIMRDIAIDVVLCRTHRERNDAYRWLVNRIKMAIENIRTITAEEIDEVPF